MRLEEATFDWLNTIAPQGILTTDTELKICGWNRWMEIHSGLRSWEVVNKSLFDVYPDLLSRRMDHYFNDALTGQVIVLSQRFHKYLFQMPSNINEGDTKYMQQSVRIAPLYKNELIIGTICIIDDVTERVAREAELQSQITALENLHEISRAILLLDLQTCLQRIVDKAAAFVNAPMAAVVLFQRGTLRVEANTGSRKLLDKLFIDDPQSVAMHVVSTGKLLRLGNVRENSEFSPLDLNNRSVVAAPLISAGGMDGQPEVIGVLVLESPDPHVFNRDDEAQVARLATQAAIAIRNAKLYEAERRARSEAEAANRAKDQFLATVSHELRTPLTAMLGWTRLLRSGKLDKLSFERALETVERNAKVQAQLIEDILDVSRIITGKLILDVRPVELVPIIEAAVDSVRPAAEAKGIKLHIILDPGISPIQGDPNRLQQVVWNLVSNAIKFTPEGGNVDIRLKLLDSQALISVSDTGKGINPEFLPYVFDRFRQADSSAARMHGGLGLGLSIVRHLVELHGGTVSADSAGEGKGATFTIKIPLAITREQVEAETEKYFESELFSKSGTDSILRLDGLRILIVDDEPDTLEMFTTMLMHTGAVVKTATSAAEAFDWLKQWRPDVLVSDIGMPQEDGYSLIKKVRALPADKGGRTPAIALTAYARTEDRMRALSYGFQMHIPKPPEPAELVVVIASLAGRIGND
jgi:PAS domain S-box-containing protein